MYSRIVLRKLTIEKSAIFRTVERNYKKLVKSKALLLRRAIYLKKTLCTRAYEYRHPALEWYNGLNSSYKHILYAPFILHFYQLSRWNMKYMWDWCTVCKLVKNAPRTRRTETHSSACYIHMYIYVTANPRNQLFPGISNPFRESEESLKWIFSKSNLTEPNLN